MDALPSDVRGYKFGAFELDLRSGELRKNGRKIELIGQPLTVLQLLLERKGEIATREDIKKRLWPDDTFVDFDRAINTAVYNLREALGDQAENPLFVQTVPKKGFQFIAPVEPVFDGVPAAPPAEVTPPQRTPRWKIAVYLAIGVVLAFVGKRVWDYLMHPPGPVTIAVVPFYGDPTEEYVSHALTEQLITKLGTLDPNLVVKSAGGYTSKDDPLKVGRALKVGYVITGSALRYEEKIEISARIISIADDRVMDPTTYRREIGDIPAMVSEISEAIADTVKIRLQPQPKPRPVNRKAYEAWSQGRFLMSKRTDRDYARSIGYLQAAIREDPNFADAHAALADVYNLIGFYGGMAHKEAYALAREEADKALALDPKNVEAHVAKADMFYVHEWDWGAARMHFEKALQYNPNYAPAHQWYGMFLVVQGTEHMDQAIKELETARDLDPVSVVINADLGLCYYYKRDYARAVEQYEKTLELNKYYSLTHNWMGLALVQMKRYDEAIEHFNKAVEYSEGSQGSYSLLSYGLGMAGRKTEAQQTLQKLLALGQSGHFVSPAYVAIAYIGLGEKDKVFEWADRCAKEHASLMIKLKVEPVVDSVRSDPRFPPLLKMIGLKP